MACERVSFSVRGQVQGVGFRPFVFTLAERFELSGFVKNTPDGVLVEVQGSPSAIASFAHSLENSLPPLARITSLQRASLAPVPGENGFSIAASAPGERHAVLISPDTATCPDCLRDMADKENRRFRYAFTNCTNCGPRYTITRSIPYDRPFTSMGCFPMCRDCLAEYTDPRNRRFHAQPNACPVCGPKVWFVESHAKGAAALRPPLDGDAALAALAVSLLDGHIAAVKGLGGFHLACDACDEQAVARLRERKQRPHKPFAVMAADIAEARLCAHIGAEEERLLLSVERPIVLCPVLPDAPLAPGIAPDCGSIGLMLPYTPLHQALFEHLSSLLGRRAGRPAVLVMTSGNPGGEPICLGNREAAAHLAAMADVFLFHNRDILIRVDDSVVRPQGDGTLFFRRARGYVPKPIALDAALAERDGPEPVDRDVCVLGAGAELKNTLCLTKGGDAFVSQHIGDMSNLETAAFHEEIREHLADLLRVSPSLVVRDLHPDYLSSRMAEEYAHKQNVPLAALQHHFAHAHAVLAENAFRGRALVLALDGTGLGEDGTLWGGELLLVDTASPGAAPVHRRLAHLSPMPLPGGEAAIREPWRIAHALLTLLDLVPQEGEKPAHPLPWLPEQAATAAVIPRMLEKKLNSPLSTSCGRLFDAASALLGLCLRTSYEGQAAIRLEEAQNVCRHERDALLAEAANAYAAYPCPVTEREKDAPLVLDTHSLFAALYADITRGTPQTLVARRFHESLCAALAALAARVAQREGVRHVGLSGGCLQNLTLAARLPALLRGSGLIPLLHRELPPGDGCISFGQAAWGRLLPEKGAAAPQRNFMPK